ncbi:hypothetical protein B7494_g5412 [Chlorociboria aeruginascens]|nr:hypothetical protein B7494_g5412 [Chlorociboria aeruginascens]
MSPRNDTFLTLCLAQAELSPLHYRHGSIIVRGGKVIGQGFNSYRPGFEGGALKTGTLPSNALDGPAIAELKQRLKSKSKSKSKPKSKSKISPENQQDSATFTPLESTGAGPNSSSPLSMHSEMMAIRSALSLSSGTHSSQTSARAAGPLARRQRPPRQAQGKLIPASSLFKSRVWKRMHVNQVGMNSARSSDKEEGSGFHVPREDVAWNGKKSGEFHRMKKGYEYQSGFGEKKGDFHEDHFVQYQHKRGVEPQNLKNSGKSSDSDTSSLSSDDEIISTRSYKTETSKKPPSLATKTQVLVSKTKTSDSKPSIAARTKDLRLKGSDLYVARLGNCNVSCTARPPPRPKRPSPLSPTPSPNPTPTSLYDELSPISRSASTLVPPVEKAPLEKGPEIRASRPCYRCCILAIPPKIRSRVVGILGLEDELRNGLLYKAILKSRFEDVIGATSAVFEVMIILGSINIVLRTTTIPFQSPLTDTTKMLSQTLRVSRTSLARMAPASTANMARRTLFVPTAARSADLLQELYLRELKAYKPTPIKASDSAGQVSVFQAPKAPQSPEETDIASELQAYEASAVEVEGQSEAGGEVEKEVDWFEDYVEEEEVKH